MKKTYSLLTLITAILCFTFCGCSLPRYNNKDKTSKTKVTEMTELTERQKKVLESEGLPTDIDKLSYQQKSGIYDIAENINICGNEVQIRQLMTILLDNAVKYCDENGVIKVSLKKKKHTILIVKNTVMIQ